MAGVGVSADGSEEELTAVAGVSDTSTLLEDTAVQSTTALEGVSGSAVLAAAAGAEVGGLWIWIGFVRGVKCGMPILFDLARAVRGKTWVHTCEQNPKSAHVHPKKCARTPQKVRTCPKKCTRTFSEVVDRDFRVRRYAY